MTNERIINTPVIPVKQQFYGVEDSWDYPAIAFFLAVGFFPSDATYFKGLKVMKPASGYRVNDHGGAEFVSTNFKWHYSPKETTLKGAADNFASLFEGIIDKGTHDKQLILPLSGGLDSRSLAAALLATGKTAHSYSYRFAQSFDETRFGREIAHLSGFPFDELIIPEGYLWDKRLALGRLNGCYSEFTHARQMAVIDEISNFGRIFLLGHWGDVLFDGSGLPEKLSMDELVRVTRKKIVKEGGLDMAEKFWFHHKLDGTFSQYLDQSIEEMYRSIPIDHAGARLRAFKSMYWAPRWTSVNIGIFASANEICLPYYNDEMCRFICEIPENHLEGRQIQIEYIKQRAPELAKIHWQGYAPCNLYNYRDFHRMKYLPYRLKRKISHMLRSKKVVTRNWEIQFAGKRNHAQLASVLAHNRNDELLPAHLTNEIVNGFYHHNSRQYSHQLSMLLTLATMLELRKTNES